MTSEEVMAMFTGDAESRYPIEKYFTLLESVTTCNALPAWDR